MKTMRSQATVWLVTLTLCASAAGCVEDRPARAPVAVVHPEQSADTVQGAIVPGSSTQADVAELLGPPSSQQRESNGTIVWTYWSTETASGNYAHQAIRVVFDARGVVQAVKTNRAAP